MVLVWWQRKAGLLCSALKDVGYTTKWQQQIIEPPQCVVLLLVNLLYSFVHRTESVSSAVKLLRILLVKIQAFVAPVL